MNFQEMLADIESSITGAIATIAAIEPAVNAVVMAVNPVAGASLVAGEAVVNEAVTLAQPVVAALQTVTTTTTSTTPAAPVADPASVAAAVAEMERAVDAKLLPYRGNPILDTLATKSKESFRRAIEDRAAAARA